MKTLNNYHTKTLNDLCTIANYKMTGPGQTALDRLGGVYLNEVLTLLVCSLGALEKLEQLAHKEAAFKMLAQVIKAHLPALIESTDIVIDIASELE